MTLILTPPIPHHPKTLWDSVRLPLHYDSHKRYTFFKKSENRNPPPIKRKGICKKIFIKNLKKRVFIQNPKDATMNEN
jgi:hypothetical protein